METALDPSIRRHRLTVEDVERMVGSGILAADAPVELLEGELIAVSPQGPGHTTGKNVLCEILRRACLAGTYLRDQDPLQCGRYSLPEPDVALVRGRPQDHRARHPRGDEAVLVVEISRTTQRVDRAKAEVYARAGVEEYWLVDLVQEVVTVHREPGESGYASCEVVDAAGVLALPDGTTCVVGDLLR